MRSHVYHATRKTRTAAAAALHRIALVACGGPEWLPHGTCGRPSLLVACLCCALHVHATVIRCSLLAACWQHCMGACPTGLDGACMSFGRRSTAMRSGRRSRPISSSTASKPAARPSQSTASSVEAMRTMRRAACNMAARKTCSMRIGHATRRRRRPFGRLRHDRSRPRCG